MKHRLLPVFIFLVLAVSFWSTARADGFESGGKYVGYGFIYNSKGEGTRTDVRMDIRTGENGLNIVELNYGENKAAKFGKVGLKSANKLEIAEDVNTGGPVKAKASGQFVTLDGSSVAGSFEIRLPGKEAERPVQSIKVFVLRLKEKPVLD